MVGNLSSVSNYYSIQDTVYTNFLDCNLVGDEEVDLLADYGWRCLLRRLPPLLQNAQYAQGISIGSAILNLKNVIFI